MGNLAIDGWTLVELSIGNRAILQFPMDHQSQISSHQYEDPVFS